MIERFAGATALLFFGAIMWRASHEDAEAAASANDDGPASARPRRALSFLATRVRPQGLGKVLPAKGAAVLCFVMAAVVLVSAVGGSLGDAADDFARRYQEAVDAKEQADARTASWIGLVPTAALLAWLGWASVSALLEGDFGGAVALAVIEFLILFLFLSLTATVGLTDDPPTLVGRTVDGLVP